jgi:hypothetical protein
MGDFPKAMTNSKISSKERKSENWERRGIFTEPRLSELIALYEELGYEVRVEPINPKDLPLEDCHECYLVQAERYRTIFTRPGA